MSGSGMPSSSHVTGIDGEREDECRSDHVVRQRSNRQLFFTNLFRHSENVVLQWEMWLSAVADRANGGDRRSRL